METNVTSIGQRIRISNQDAPGILNTIRKGVSTAFRGCGRTADEDTLSEIANEAFCRILSANTFNPERGTVDGWAYLTGKNVAIDWLRGKVAAGARHYNETDIGTVEDDDGNAKDIEIPDYGPNAEDQLFLLQREEWLNEEIERLPPAQKQAIMTARLDNDSENLSGSARINKMRAIDAIVSNLPKALRGSSVRSKNKGRTKKK
jgi:DNA-directed RNA polymerase specialized sigma24 family protein